MQPQLVADVLHGTRWQQLGIGGYAKAAQDVLVVAQPTLEGGTAHVGSQGDLIFHLTLHDGGMGLGVIWGVHPGVLPCPIPTLMYCIQRYK